MSNVPMHFLDRIRLDFLAMSLISGLIIMFCSPLRLFIPTWMKFPFSVDSTPEVLYRFLAILVSSICLGIPVWFIAPLITSDIGLNHWLSSFLPEKCQEKKDKLKKNQSDKENSIQLEELKEYEYADFTEWTIKKGVRSYVDFLVLDNAIFTGFLCTSEMVFFSNLLVVLVGVKSGLLPLSSSFCTGIMVWLVLIPCFIFFGSLVYNIEYYKDWILERWENLVRGFKEYQKEIHGKEGNVMSEAKKCPRAVRIIIYEFNFY